MEAMAKDSPHTPKLTAKLSLLVKRDQRSKSEIASSAGIAVQALNHYLAGTSPRPDTALALARTLGVDPIWLIDEDAPAKEGPAKGCEYAFGQLDPIAATYHFNAHYERRARAVCEALAEAERIDWASVGEQIVEAGSSGKLPGAVRSAILHVNRLKSVLAGMQVYGQVTANPVVEWAFPDEPDRESLELAHLMARLFHITQRMEASDEVRRILFVGEAQGNAPAMVRLLLGAGYRDGLTDVKGMPSKDGVAEWGGGSTNVDAAVTAREAFKALADQGSHEAG